MDKFLDERKCSIFLPLLQIEDAVGAKLKCSCSTTNEIRKTDPSGYNMAIERSLFTYFPNIIKLIPEELAAYREGSAFYSKVTKFLQGESKKLKEDISLPPKEQICFSGALKEIKCFNLHLANTLNNELFISDVFLQNIKNPNCIEETSVGFKGLGNGIFDEIMKNIEKFAELANYSKIGLLASNKTNMEIFARRGFVIEHTHHGKMAKIIELSYPMVKKLS
jgi:hypothetical protein